MTDTIQGGLNAALATLQTKLPRITKDNTAKVETRTGGSYRYTYADLAQISAQVLPIMGSVGLSFTSRPTARDGRFVLVYELRHTSGEVIDGEYPLPAPDRSTPQEVGSAITYARRYCLCAVTGVAPEDDDEDAAVAQQAATRRGREPRGDQPQQQTAGGNGQQPITGEQSIRLQKAFQAYGAATNADKAALVAEVVKRPVKGSAELTQLEAGRVIKHVEQKAAEKAKTQQPTADAAPSAEAKAPA
ncbi:ERF family protein [Micromonospora tulbaghiae]|uniref:ERF family protein n=1 Tax=Micromonospora tulbaghiae TaxID=479978 RepID=UPI0033AB038E